MPLGDPNYYPRAPRMSQRARNERWPLMDPNGRRHAEGIPDQRHPIPVVVRVDLEHDGETWLPGMAARWTKTHVYVNGIDDHRIHAVWVRAEDVRRR